jgi:periplasmic divalent cation tolerance protein
VIKTRQELYEQVEESIKALHPYETPEIIAIPILSGSNDYLKWITAVVKG